MPPRGPATWSHTKAREGTEGNQMTDKTDSTIKAAIYLLERGLVSYSEIAALANVKRQTVRWWARKLDPDARAQYLKEQWDKALKRAGN